MTWLSQEQCCRVEAAFNKICHNDKIKRQELLSLRKIAGFEIGSKAFGVSSEGVDLTGLLQILFPLIPKWNAISALAEIIPESQLLLLKGELADVSLKQCDLNFKNCFIQITKDSGGLLSREKLIECGQRIGNMNLPEEVFNDYCRKMMITIESSHEFRATFKDVLSMLFPRVSNTMISLCTSTEITSSICDSLLSLFQKFPTTVSSSRFILNNHLNEEMQFIKAPLLHHLSEGSPSRKIHLQEMVKALFPNVTRVSLQNSIRKFDFEREKQNSVLFEDDLRESVRAPILRFLENRNRNKYTTPAVQSKEMIQNNISDLETESDSSESSEDGFPSSMKKMLTIAQQVSNGKLLTSSESSHKLRRSSTSVGLSNPLAQPLRPHRRESNSAPVNGRPIVKPRPPLKSSSLASRKRRISIKVP